MLLATLPQKAPGYTRRVLWNRTAAQTQRASMRTTANDGAQYACLPACPACPGLPCQPCLHAIGLPCLPCAALITSAGWNGRSSDPRGSRRAAARHVKLAGPLAQRRGKSMVLVFCFLSLQIPDPIHGQSNLCPATRTVPASCPHRAAFSFRLPVRTATHGHFLFLSQHVTAHARNDCSEQ